MDKRNRPHEYIVYTDRPGYGGGYTCKVRTLKIPRGKTFNDMRDYLPPTVGKLAVVSAYSADTARAGAAQQRGIKCASGGLSSASKRGSR